MDKNQLKIQINILRTKFKFLSGVGLRNREDYEWLLVEVKAEIAKSNTKLKGMTQFAIVISLLSLFLSIASMANVSNTELSIIILFLFIILALLLLGSITIESYDNNNIKELTKLEKYIEYFIEKNF